LTSQKSAFPFPFTEKVLANGLRIFVVPYDSPGLVAYYSVVRTGSRNEVEAGKSGFAHFFEHMMFRGTERYATDRYNAGDQGHGRGLQRIHRRGHDRVPHPGRQVRAGQGGRNRG